MKLYVSAGSPYSRRARIAVREAGLGDQIEEVDANDLPDRKGTLLKLGPGGKIPTLMLDNGTALSESMIIAHYLDRLSGGKLYPADEFALADCYRVEAVGAVLMDSLHVRSVQGRLDPSEQSPRYIKKEAGRCGRCYDTLESMLGLLTGQTHFSALTVAASLSYADWRGAADNWRDSHPKLDAWMKSLESHPSLAATARPDS
jgi:glutathione S-transferase